MAREEYIRIYRSDVAGATPSLTSGEIAANLVDGKFFIGGTNGSLITFTTDSYSVTGVNGLTGNVSITGDGGAVQGKLNNTITARVATDSLTGVASFSSTYFSVANGAVSLASAYQVTGDTVQAGSGISIGTGKVITNIGVTGVTTGTPSYGNTGFNGLLISSLTGNITIENTGVRALTVQGYASTTSPLWYQKGPQIRASGGINVVAGWDDEFGFNSPYISVLNTGVLSINGLGGILLITGDGGAVYGVGNETIAARVATESVTGVARFDTNTLTVSDGLVSAKSVTINDSIGGGGTLILGGSRTFTGKGISIAWQGAGTLEFANIGVTSFNGLTGNVSLTGDGQAIQGKGNNSITARVATESLTGVASFSNTHFSVSNGAVSLASAYQVTGDTVITVAGSGIGIATSGKTDTIYNIGVTSFNGVTGNVSLTGDGQAVQGKLNNTITARVATNSLTGVASFSSNFFTVSNGAVSLASPYSVIGVTGIGFGNDVGLTGKINLTAGTNITLTRSGNTITIDGVAQQITAVTGDGGAIEGKGNAFITARVATSSLTGVAAFNDAHFSINEETGYVSLLYPYDPTNVAFKNTSNVFTSKQYFTAGISADSIYVGSGLTSIELAYRAVGDSFEDPTKYTVIKANDRNGMYLLSSNGGATASSILLTSGGIALGHNTQGGFATVSIGNAIVDDIVAVPLTNYNSRIVMTAYDTFNGSGTFTLRTPTSLGSAVDLTLPSASGTLALTRNLVSSFNGLTGIVSLTGDGGAVQGKLNNSITVRVVADNAMTGVASFDASHFAVGSTGHVRSKGVMTINGVAPTDGNFTIAAATVVTGDGGAIQGKGDAFITARLTTAAGATGLASFRDTYFLVDATGHVQLASAYQVTGQTVVAGYGIDLVSSGNTRTINNRGVTSFNGLTGNVSLTGDGQAIQGKLNNTITARVATDSLTGVASFSSTYFSVAGNGAVSLATAYQATGDTVITVAGSGIGIVTSGKTDTLYNIGVTGIGFGNDVGLTGKINVTAGSGITITRAGNTITIGGAAATVVTGDSGAIQGKLNTTITARHTTSVIVTNNGIPSGAPGAGTTLATYEQYGEGSNVHGQTGVGYFDIAHFVVKPEYGLVQLRNPAFAPDAPQFTGLNATGPSDGSLSYMYFDVGSLTFDSATTLDPNNDFVIFYDASESGLIKTKRMKSERILLDNDSVFNSKSTQFVKSKSSSNIEFEILTAPVTANETKLLKSGDAFTYISQNTVKSLNGATGDVTVVGNINGCTGAIVITGTTNEVVVSNSCPNITIGLPDNVSIPYLSGTGATFTQTVTANRFIGTVSGGDF